MLPRTCPVCSQPRLSYEDDVVSCVSCGVYSKPVRWFQVPLVWAIGRAWWWRSLILLWFVTVLFANLRDDQYALNRFGNPLSALDFGIHELGHILFGPFGDFMRIAGGSLFQCLFPLLFLIGCLQKRWFFAAALSWCWLGLNLFDVATYVADARVRLLSLSVGPGVFGIDPTGVEAAYDQAHDWYQLLSITGRLEADTAIAGGLRAAGTAAFILGFVLGGMLLIQMLRGKNVQSDSVRQTEPEKENRVPAEPQLIVTGRQTDAVNTQAVVSESGTTSERKQP